MNYPLSKKTRNKRVFKFVCGAVILIILFFFRTPIFSGLSYVSHMVLRPIFVFGNDASGRLGTIVSFFSSKKSLILENETLKTELTENKNFMSNYNSILAENVSLKEILGRKGERNMLLSAILSKPNKSLYDTLVVDVGASRGVQVSDRVFALGSVPIGRVIEVYPNSSKVVLFSNNREKTSIIISSSNIFMDIVGRGGGNFEMLAPRDFVFKKGDEVILPGITPYVVAIVESVISDPQDSFQKVLLISPVNIQELKFVEIEQ